MARLKLRPFLVTAAMLGVALPVCGEEPLVTDRPDFTESSSTVGRGVLQLESGMTHAELAGGDRITTAGEVLARWGVLDGIELRFLLPSYARESAGHADASGFLDSAFGCKLQLARGDGNGVLGAMEASLIASTTMPTGSSEFQSSSWQPSAVFAASWELAEKVGLGVNAGVARPAEEGDRFTSTWLSTALGLGVSDPMSVFLELIAFDREEARGPSTFTFQTGAVYLLGPNLQLDLRVARRLSDSGLDLLVGAGISWRLGL